MRFLVLRLPGLPICAPVFKWFEFTNRPLVRSSGSPIPSGVTIHPPLLEEFVDKVIFLDIYPFFKKFVGFSLRFLSFCRISINFLNFCRSRGPELNLHPLTFQATADSSVTVSTRWKNFPVAFPVKRLSSERVDVWMWRTVESPLSPVHLDEF